MQRARFGFQGSWLQVEGLRFDELLAGGGGGAAHCLLRQR